MAVARPATETDRLPWLDNRVHRRRRNLRPILAALFALVVFLGVSTLAFRYGQQSVTGAGSADGNGEPIDHSVSRELPPAVTLPPEPQAQAPVTPAQAAPKTAVGAERQRTVRKTAKRRVRPKLKPEPVQNSELAKVTSEQEAKAAAPAPVRTRYSGYWPTPATAVRIGRVIQIGTFSNARRASSAWERTVRRYPQVAALPHITSTYKARNGRTYHRLQIMTTAPEQSQWLCQKMRADGRRCTVLGSPA